jgi:GDP-L-fucose synthase
MTPNSRVYVAGHRGLAGSALLRRLQAKGYRKLPVRTHAELELTDQRAVRAFFEAERPEVVFLAAAKVGGILANNTYPADFIAQNLAIQTNVMEEARRAGVRELLFLGSACIYPRDCPQPIKEEYLLTGPLEPTNRPYALAKIAGLEMCWAFNRQYGSRYLCAMPNNMYGPGDNYDLETSHVLAALIRKFHDAKAGGARKVTLWGTGTPRREFLHSDDMADACVHLMELPAEKAGTLLSEALAPLVNIGSGDEVSIAQLAEKVRRAARAEDVAIEWDRTKPDGTPRKLLDATRLAALGWRAKIPLDEGITRTYAEYAARER